MPMVARLNRAQSTANTLIKSNKLKRQELVKNKLCDRTLFYLIFLIRREWQELDKHIKCEK
jgi:hypothetical protein